MMHMTSSSKHSKKVVLLAIPSLRSLMLVMEYGGLIVTPSNFSSSNRAFNNCWDLSFASYTCIYHIINDERQEGEFVSSLLLSPVSPFKSGDSNTGKTVNDISGLHLNIEVLISSRFNTTAQDRRKRVLGMRLP
jgi:hypothetical protein